MTRLVIATRRSRLALWQAEHVQRMLMRAGDVEVTLLPMTTRGDQITDRTLSKVGGKGLFVKELETALADGRADIAVHSLKDVPMDLPPGFALDSADSPAPFKVNDVAAYGVKMQILGKNEKLIYHRNWMFNALIFPQTSYAGIKQVFDMVHLGDSHTITFKQAAAQ